MTDKNVAFFNLLKQKRSKPNWANQTIKVLLLQLTQL